MQTVHVIMNKPRSKNVVFVYVTNSVDNTLLPGSVIALDQALPIQEMSNGVQLCLLGRYTKKLP